MASFTRKALACCLALILLAFAGCASTTQTSTSSSVQSPSSSSSSAQETGDSSSDAAGNAGSQSQESSTQETGPAEGASVEKAPANEATPAEKPVQESNIDVFVRIDSSNAGSKSIGSFGRALNLHKGASAYDALVACGVSVGGSSSYVSSINGLSEKACGPTSGWTYYVNGSFPSKAAGSYRLSDGDEVLWYYVSSYDDRP